MHEQICPNGLIEFDENSFILIKKIRVCCKDKFKHLKEEIDS